MTESEFWIPIGVPVSGLSRPRPASRSTVWFNSSEFGPFSDTRPHIQPRDFS